MAQLAVEELDLLKRFKLKIIDLLEELPEYHKTDALLMTWIRARANNLPSKSQGQAPAVGVSYSTSTESVHHSQVQLVRACDENLLDAEKMIRKAALYRRETDFYHLHKWMPPADMLRDYPYEIIGSTPEGCPVAVIKFGNWDVRHMVEIGQGLLLLKYTLRMFALLVDECADRSQLPDIIVSQFVLLVDLDGFSMRQSTCRQSLEAMFEATSLFESQFPEMLHSATFINAPKFFPVFYGLFWRLLSKKTIAKIQILGTNVDKWKNVLLRNFPADHLPREYGGFKPDLKRDKMAAHINHASESELDDLLRITIPSGQDFRLFFHVTSSDSQIRWIFRIADHDIGFSVLFCARNASGSVTDDWEEVYPYEKCNSHFMQQEGSFRCSRPGNYYLVFDNKYSRVRAKVLHYKASVTMALGN